MDKNEQKNEFKIGNPTKSEMDFTMGICDSLSLLKRRQYQKIKLKKHLNKDDVYDFLKEKYKLVKLKDDFIVVRYSKSVGVLITKTDVKLLRFYDFKRTFTLLEMIDNYIGTCVYVDYKKTEEEENNKFSFRTIDRYNTGWAEESLLYKDFV
jgi:hypothetical protein